MNSVLVTCDDCGLSEGINRAALALHELGIAGSASVMVNFPATRHALDLFRQAPSFNVGVHLNLTDGFPLTTMPAASGLLRPDGRFRAMPSLIRRSLAPAAGYLSTVEAELRAQIDVVAQGGLSVQHLSTHLHFHAIPALRAIVLRLAEAYHVSWVRPWRLRATILPFNPLLDRALGANGRDLRPDYLAVVKHWLGRRPADLARALAHLHGNVELVVHPGIEADHTFPRDVNHSPRERLNETQYLERCWPLIARLVA
jgi:predicted glycoside hydrolase/deacetylase ChbG (UPF0249 family)